MGWRVTTPPATLPVSLDEIRAQTNVTSERHNELLMSYVAQATAHAEERLSMSLVARTITADFEMGEEINLPRGPVIQIQSVTDGAGTPVEYERYRVGSSDRVRVSHVQRHPLTIIYRAGWESVADIPADIVGMIRIHAATLFSWREDISVVGANPVHRVDDFYRRRGAGAPVA